MEALFDKRIACGRVAVENIFNEHYSQFSRMGARRALKFVLSPIGKGYTVVKFHFHLCNIFHQNQVSQRFNVKPPLLHEYMN